MNKLRKIANDNDAQIKIDREKLNKEINEKLELEEKANEISSDGAS